MEGEKKFGEAYRKFRLCVDSYEAGVPKGRVCRPGMKGESVAFQSLSQMLVRMEAMMDEANYPQSFTAKRTFAPISEAFPEPAGPAARTGELATFVVRVLFRQHASWQGTVVWLEGEGEQTFRSVLELILLMDSALGGARRRTSSESHTVNPEAGKA